MGCVHFLNELVWRILTNVPVSVEISNKIKSKQTHPYTVFDSLQNTSFSLFFNGFS